MMKPKYSDETKKKIFNAFPFFPDEDIDEILHVIRRILKGEQKLTRGPLVEEFENGFSRYVDAEHSIAVHSCTSALEIILRYFQVENHEVIVPAQTFIATANAVENAGGKPVFADIDAETLCLSAELIAPRITPQTKGVILVNMLGMIPPDLDQIVELCKKHHLFLIEDSAHSIGAAYHGKKSGNLTDAAVFSFFSTKIMATGEGGMITTNHPDLADFARSIRNHGLDQKNIDCRFPGTNVRLDEIRSILGIIQLRRLNEFLTKRRKIAQKYKSALDLAEGLSTTSVPEYIHHSYWKFPVFVSAKQHLDKMKQIFFGNGIEVSAPYDPPCHLHSYYKKKYGYKPGTLPNAENLLKRYFCLPVHADLSESDTDRVVNNIFESTKY